MSIQADILAAAVPFAAPLLPTAPGGMFSYRSGTNNIVLAGIMIIGALFGTIYQRFINAAGLGTLNQQGASRGSRLPKAEGLPCGREWR